MKNFWGRAMFVSLFVLLTAGTSMAFMFVLRPGQTEKREMVPKQAETGMRAMAPVRREPEQLEEVKDSGMMRGLEEILILVNGTNPLPVSYACRIVTASGISIDQRVVHPLAKMTEAAQKDGIVLRATAGYYAGKTDTGSCGEHETGLALDFGAEQANFASTKEFAWLAAHAVEFGFVLRYPKEKEAVTGIPLQVGHFRYVGVENAQRMKEKKMCLEEYVDYLMDKH